MQESSTTGSSWDAAWLSSALLGYDKDSGVDSNDSDALITSINALTATCKEGYNIFVAHLKAANIRQQRETDAKPVEEKGKEG